MEYSTKNKIKVLNCFISNKDRHMIIEDIYAYLSYDVPLASLYRIVDSLVKDGLVRKYSIDNTKASCFQYNEEGLHNHFHLLCTKCGKVIHLECDEVNHLISHIKKDHNFDIDISRVNLYGLCEQCKKDNHI